MQSFQIVHYYTTIQVLEMMVEEPRLADNERVREGRYAFDKLKLA